MRSLTQLSIKSKLIAMLLAVSSCSILVTAYIGYQSGQSNLTNRAFNQLTSVRASKAYQIESYFKTLRSHIQTLSENPSVIEAMQEFDTNYRLIESSKIPIQNLSQDITLKHFGAGEKVVQQGYTSNALYIAIAGQAMMTVIDKNDREQEVLPIKAGEFFNARSPCHNADILTNVIRCIWLRFSKASFTVRAVISPIDIDAFKRGKQVDCKPYYRMI
jgi:hypothetical protein